MSSSYHQTIVVELGSSRIKVGFAGESKPRRVFNDVVWATDDGSWVVPINDGMGARPCIWGRIFQYLPFNDLDTGVKSRVASVYEWEQTLYPLFSHLLTSVLFVQRPSRHRVLILTNDIFPPRHLREALSTVILSYLGLGGLLVVNGGGFNSISYLLDGLPPSIKASSRPKAHLFVDVGTYESRTVVSVAGLSILECTYQTTMSGYHSFLLQILNNYQTDARSDEEGKDSESKNVTEVATLQDANAVVQAWLSVSIESLDATTLSVDLPSVGPGRQTSVQLPIEPLQMAFHQIYLDYTNPSSLIYAVLASALACPIDYRRIALQNVQLLGGGSTALRYFCHSTNTGDEIKGLGHELMRAARKACGISNRSNSETVEEKKDDDSRAVSSIAKERFQCLAAAVSSGGADKSGECKGGMSVSYPDPFAADLAAWIGGSIMGSLDLKNEEWLTKTSGSGAKAN